MLKHSKPNRCTSPILKGLYNTFQAGLGILDLWLHHISNNTAIIITRYIWIRSCKLSISQSLRDLCVPHGPLNTWSLCARDQPVPIHDCMALYLCVDTALDALSKRENAVGANDLAFIDFGCSGIRNLFVPTNTWLATPRGCIILAITKSSWVLGAPSVWSAAW